MNPNLEERRWGVVTAKGPCLRCGLNCEAQVRVPADGLTGKNEPIFRFDPERDRFPRKICPSCLDNDTYDPHDYMDHRRNGVRYVNP